MDGVEIQGSIFDSTRPLTVIVDTDGSDSGRRRAAITVVHDRLRGTYRIEWTEELMRQIPSDLLAILQDVMLAIAEQVAA